MLDAAKELGLIWNLPGRKPLEVVKEQAAEAVRELVGNLGEAFALENGVADLLKAPDQRHGHVEEGLLEGAHALEDVHRLVGDHEAGEKDASVDLPLGQRIRGSAVAEGAEVMNAL